MLYPNNKVKKANYKEGHKLEELEITEEEISKMKSTNLVLLEHEKKEKEVEKQR